MGATIQLEHFWDELAKTYEVNILCGCVLGSLDHEPESQIYKKLCAEHSVVY